MGKQTYDKPTRVLIREMASSLGLQPGQVLTTTRTLELFREHYPKLQANSIKAHLTQASTNDPNRLHHAVKPEDDFFVLG